MTDLTADGRERDRTDENRDECQFLDPDDGVCGQEAATRLVVEKRPSVDARWYLSDEVAVCDEHRGDVASAWDAHRNVRVTANEFRETSN